QYSYNGQQNQYQNYGYQGYNNNPNNFNEFSYQPPKKKKHKGLVTAVVVVLCAAVVGVTGVVGVSVFSKKDGNESGTSPSNTTASANKDDSSSERTNLPTIEQLSTPDDAMKIPDIVKKVSPSVVGISCITESGTVTGTGIIMSEDGYIITNAHVVDGASAISAVLPSNYDGKDSSSTADSSSETDKDIANAFKDSDDNENSIKAELIGKDTQTDIAVIKINKTGLSPVEFGKSADVQVGEASIVIGNPLGLDLANSVTAGIISATDRTLTIDDRTMNLIQTDAAINSGNSGGPLINAYGQVIGITSAKVASTYGEALGFAIPIDEALPIVKDLMENGYVKNRPTLGISGMNISDIYSQYYDVPKGFIVKSVTAGSAAEKAGIQENDIIVGIQGNLIESIEEFNAIKEKYKAGDTITVSLYRNKKITDVKVTLDEMKETDTDSSENQQQEQDQLQEFYKKFGF
ncbi:MAG: S1C family serine protease, partial [Oscillospiraceae bacterium]